MTSRHRNKTLATFLAAVFGGLGLHRFYLYGKKDVWAWVHILTFPFSIAAGFIEALVFGLAPDEKWDAQYNPDSGRRSDSGWPVIFLVVLTFALGSTVITAAIARVFDLYLTGGAYG